MPELHKIIVLLLVFSMLFAFTGCTVPENMSRKQTTGFTVPENMSREQAALFTAIADVCPKDKNRSKAEYLTFYIEGWSFDSFPPEILNYLNEYCANGKANFIQLTFDELKTNGYIIAGDGGFYAEDEQTYMLGKGKIFTFIKAGDENSGAMTVKLKTFSSDNDSSGYDIELVFEKDAWRVERYSNPWGKAYMNTPKPEAENAAPHK